MNALARRVVACEGWCWREGMAGTDHEGARWRICAGEGGHLYAVGEPSGYIGGWLAFAAVIGAVPDLTDPATMGCLLHLVRTVRNEPRGFVTPPGALSVLWGYASSANPWPPEIRHLAATEAEVLVLALENAPCSAP